MDLSEILAISGKPGLYKMVSQTKNSIVVESLEDKKRFPAFSSERISALDDISIYTYDGDVPLKEIMQKIADKENNGKCIDPKESNDELKVYFEQILAEYDQERVYISDIKKVFRWYNTLQELDLLEVIKEEEKEEESEQKEEPKTDIKEEKSEVEKEDGEGEEITKPKKKATPKSTEEKKTPAKKKAAPKAKKEENE